MEYGKHSADRTSSKPRHYTHDSWRGHNFREHFAFWRNNDDWISEAWYFDCSKQRKGKENSLSRTQIKATEWMERSDEGSHVSTIISFWSDLPNNTFSAASAATKTKTRLSRRNKERGRLQFIELMECFNHQLNEDVSIAPHRYSIVSLDVPQEL